jgi:diguanylate cyclase (GGDEF)-like protein
MRRRNRGLQALAYLFSTLLLAGVVVRAHAAASGVRPLDLFDLGAPSFTTFGFRDGLPDSVAVTLRTDPHGFVWVGTQHGLARYDGRRWIRVDDPALQGYVDQLFVDHEERLWASSRTFGLARYDGTRWHVESAASGMTTTHVRRLVEMRAADGWQLWAVTWDAGLFHRSGGTWHADPGNAQLPRGTLLSLAQAASAQGGDRQWVGTGNQGLWYRDGHGPWRKFRAPGFDANDIESLRVTRDDGDEALWISAFGSGLWRLDAHGLRHWSVESGELPTNELYNMVETPTPGGGQALWIASRAGLLRLYRDRVRVFDRSLGLPSNAIRGVYAWRSPDGAEVLWLATESGVARAVMGPQQWKTVSLMGAHGVGVFRALIDPDGHGGERLWVASMGDGLGLYEDGAWRYFNQANGALPGSEVRVIKRMPDADGRSTLWVGTQGGYLLRVRAGPRFEQVATPWPHDHGESINDALGRVVDGKAEQWFATGTAGIYRLRGRVWTAFRPEGLQGPWNVRGLLMQTTADGHAWLWATGPQGLARFDGTHWVLLGRDTGLPSTSLLGVTLLPDTTGRPILWLGSVHDGIIRVDVSDPMHPRVLPADLPPPPDPNAYGAQRDSRGRIYICTNAGVQMLVPKSGGYASRVFTSRDGMVNDECNGNSQFIDAHGRFWTGTLGGLTVYDPAPGRPDRDAKPFELIGVSVDNKPVAASQVRIPPGHHDLRVEFALLSWQKESESRFRTFLEGFDARSGPWSAEAFRDFGALPAGDYTLRVEARDYAGNLSKPILLPISVLPEWWQRRSVQGLLALLALVTLYGFTRWRTHASLHRQQVLEQRITERTLELNIANQRLLDLSHRDALTNLFNRRRLLELMQEMRGAAFTALIFVDVDHFKRYNDTHGHPAGDEALRVVADAMRRCAPADAIVARYGGEEFACVLPGFDANRAAALAEKIRVAVAASSIAVPGKGVTRRVTISAGIAARGVLSDEDAHALLRDADDALYRAKRDGRDCVRIAES